MKSAGKARNNGLYRHIRTSKEIIRNLLNDFKNILKSIIFGIFKTDKGMGEGDSEGIWDAAMGEMTRWVLHMGRWISLERASWKGDHRFGCL